jgi:small subunit ribosomal protein S4
MGAPKRNRRTYDKPKEIWNLQRINTDNALREEFGLRSMRELWKAQTEISRIRGNVRALLSGAGTAQGVKERMLDRLSRFGIASRNATLDDLLDLKENALLARRLQSVVFKKGLAKTPKQARQLIVHGHISVKGRRVNVPSYLVSIDEEAHVGYYKPIDIGMKNVSAAGAEHDAPGAEESTPAQEKDK